MKTPWQKLVLATCIQLAAALAVSRVVYGAESTTTDSPSAPKSSLDDQLLRGVDNSLQNTPSSHADKPIPSEQPTTKKVSRQFSPSYTAAGAPSNALANIVIQMRQVQQRLAAGKSDKLTQQQQQRISEELKSLLDQMAKSQAQGQFQDRQSGKPGQGNSQQASRGTPKPGNSQAGKTPAATASNQPARNSNPKLRKNQDLRPDAAVEYDVTVKELDRLHLPSKDREAMLDAPADEFLPGHEESISEYFKRLVEQEDK